MQARCKLHYCKTCKKGFAAWNPDSMKFWPPCVQKQLYRQVYIGRKSALARTLVQRAVREFPMGLAPGHMAKEMNERKVRHDLPRVPLSLEHSLRSRPIPQHRARLTRCAADCLVRRHANWRRARAT